MQIKGLILHARVEFVREHFGEDAWGRVLESMSDEDREIIGDTIITAKWYPFEVGERLGSWDNLHESSGFSKHRGGNGT